MADTKKSEKTVEKLGDFDDTADEPIKGKDDPKGKAVRKIELHAVVGAPVAFCVERDTYVDGVIVSENEHGFDIDVAGVIKPNARISDTAREAGEFKLVEPKPAVKGN